MNSSKIETPRHECEAAVAQNYDHDFAAIYRCVWDSYLGERQERLFDEMARENSWTGAILDAAAGTGELAARLAARGHHVTANELSDAMRHYISERQLSQGTTGSLVVLEPGVTWRNLPASLEGRTFGLVYCIGAALAHCNNSGSGVLKESLLALASLVSDDGFLLVDCKRYSDDGWELRGDGTKRPHTITDSATVEWRDLTGKPRRGLLRSSFAISSDHSLTRIFRYEEETADCNREREWVFQTWPVARAEIQKILSFAEMELIWETVVGGVGEKLPMDTLLFRKRKHLRVVDS